MDETFSNKCWLENNRTSNLNLGQLCLTGGRCSGAPRDGFKYCGTAIPSAMLPEKTLLFYEHDNGGNTLQRLVVDVPDTAETVAVGGSMILGGPSADYGRGHLYFFQRTVLG